MSPCADQLVGKLGICGENPYHALTVILKLVLVVVMMMMMKVMMSIIMMKMMMINVEIDEQPATAIWHFVSKTSFAPMQHSSNQVSESWQKLGNIFVKCVKY